jgi:hypothetical protein
MATIAAPDDEMFHAIVPRFALIKDNPSLGGSDSPEAITPVLR